MDRFQQLEVFVAVAEEQGFAAAARRLRKSPPAVTRMVSALEDRLGVRLLQRTTRQVRATEAGLRYLEDARRILELVQQADEAAAGVNAEPRGLLRVTAPVLFGRLHVTPGINEYLRQFPQVQVDALFLDRVVNLLEEGIDVGVRIGELPDSSMRALRVGQVRHLICASPGYLEVHGRPGEPGDLPGHSLIQSRAGSMDPAWRFANASRLDVLRPQPRFSVTTNDAAIAAAVEGLGLVRQLSYQVAEQLEKGSLLRVLEAFEPPALPVHIVHREDKRSSGKVRSFIDLMAKRLRESLAAQ